ncbi:putative iron-regulated membrane protein [Sphingomonas jejuensis]|uniref:Iron-regulated membrane protein n=1 Tax=Sphingomonas jejuensis TaxID=904715 RepID=A0ABX0XKG0_9SPHN|nr:PepSY-associated TM helix domain-containing protein [Sphingomonas jejuensis]NJC33836.1 putative iron-regulated membrane protein [Sphingomonas jejuensis]
MEHPPSPISRVRRTVRQAHLWLGLGIGALFALLGLTGSMLVFYTGIDAVLHPAISQVEAAPPPALDAPAWDRALATGRARWRDPAGKWTLEITGDGGTIPARYYPMPGHHADRMMVWFSADGARIVRAEPWGGYLMSWIYQLHMQLLAGDIGHQIVGWSGIAMLVLLITGLVAWWPRASWQKAFAFKRGAPPIRRLRDLHKLMGLWSLAALIVLVATGVFLALPAVTQALLSPAAVPASRSAGGASSSITVATALTSAQRALPDGRIVFVDIPTASEEPIRVRAQVPGDPHRRFPGSYVFVDQHSGRVLAVHDVRRAGTGSLIVSWIRPLHDGSVGGLPGRILAMLIGLAPAFLFATGLRRWRHRRAARRASL